MASSYQCIYSKDSRTITLIKDADSLKATHSYKGNGITSYLLWDIDASSGYKQDVIFIMEGDKCPKYAYYFPEFYFNEQIYPHVIYFGKFDSFYLGGANTTEILSLAKNAGEDCSNLNLESSVIIEEIFNKLKFMEEKLKNGVYHNNEEDYYEELDNHKIRLNLLKDNHRRRGCSFIATNQKKVKEVEEQIRKLEGLNPDDELPACEYLGVETVALIQKVFSIIKIFVPILLILLGSVDLSRAVLAGDEKDMKMAQKSLLQRFLAGVGIYFLPAILNLVLKLAGITGGTCNIG